MGCLWLVFVVWVGGSRASRSKGLAWAPRDNNSRELNLEEAPGESGRREEGRIMMAGPGEELQGADGVTRASEINKAGWSTAGVRSVGAPQARSGMVGLDGPSAVLFSRSRTVLLDARNWGRRMQGSGHTGVPAAQCWLSLSHLPAPGSLHFSPCPFSEF